MFLSVAILRQKVFIFVRSSKAGQQEVVQLLKVKL